MVQRKTPKSKGRKKPAAKASQPSEPVRVIVEMRVTRDQPEVAAMAAAEAVAAPGFQLDSSYEPVPVGAPPDQAAALEAAREATVVVRGTIGSESEKDALERQENVVKVWWDTPIAPFDAGGDDEFEVVQPLAPTASACPIPPCDCDPGTPKGTISDVARYLGVDQIWSRGHRGSGIIIGIVDGGITAQGRPIKAADRNHTPTPNCPIRWPNKLIPRVVGGWPTADWGTTGVDWCWHGNMTATDALGMAPEAQIYDIRISDGNAISQALQGFNWAINEFRAGRGPHILSNSWGIFQEAWDRLYARDPNHPFTRKVVEALDEGILVLFAAGNCGGTCPDGRCAGDNGPNRSIWGANGHPRVMTVGAANRLEQFIGYSSQGPAALDPDKPDFCSLSHFTGFFNSDSGTSAATPVAAGVVALLKQAKPNLTEAAAKAALKSTAKNIGPAGWDQHSGSGIIQGKAAYDQLVGVELPCSRERALAIRNRDLYQRTRKRIYLCYYYRAIAGYLYCLYKKNQNVKYLCASDLYRGKYYCCLHQVTRSRRHLCLCYRYLAGGYCCLFRETRNPQYLNACRRYQNAYRRCMG